MNLEVANGGFLNSNLEESGSLIFLVI